jgi:small subunit ribosomal protein S3
LGQKVHPIGFRLGIINDWRAKWHADKHYADFLQEDLRIRSEIEKKYPEAGISSVEIEREASEVVVSIYTARPGIVIGRGGQRVAEIRFSLEKLIAKRVRLNIQEIRQPELDAYLVARHIAGQIERQISYRRAMKQAISRTMEAGAKGIKVICSGRLGGAEIARRATLHEGRVPLHTLRANIDYGLSEARTVMGRIGVKIWIYKGDVLPPPKEIEMESPQPATTVSSEEQETEEPQEESQVQDEAQVTEQSSEVINDATTEAS